MPQTPAFTDSVLHAEDGTRIGYRSLGSGPGVLIVHGAMQSATSQRDLAILLSRSYRVHLIDRRGRGSSGPSPAAITTAVEVSDVRAVLSATGTRRLLGISSGALIAARAVLADPATIERLALFEPPLSISGSMRLELIPPLNAAILRGDLATGAGIGMKISEMGPPWMFNLPLPVLSAVSRRMLVSDERRQLVRALPVDCQIVLENADQVMDFAAITGPTLLINGSGTRPYLRKAAAALAERIPGARRVELPRLSHAVTQNHDEFGHPEAVVPTLLDFFE